MSKRKLGFGLGASLLALTVAAPALGAVVDYPNGSDNTSPIVLTDNSTQFQVTTGAATQSGVISESGGSFRFEQIGDGQLYLTAANTYTGGTLVSGGSLMIGHGGTTGSIVGDVALANAGTGITFMRSDDITFSGNISGGGFVNQYGTGVLTLTGNNTYTGGTAILLGGTLAVSGDANLGSGPVGFYGGTLRFLSSTTSALDYPIGSGAFDTNGNTVTLSGTLSTQPNTNVAGGYGGLTKVGAGVLILTGTNNLAGPTLISAGALQIGNGSTTGSLGTPDVTDNGALIFDRSDTVTVTQAISGNGSLVQEGSGTLTIFRGESYTGGTTVTSGVLQLGSGGFLATTGALTMNGGTFDLNGHAQTVGALSGTGTILGNQGFLTTVSDTDTILAASIIGADGLTKAGTGTLTLTGNNSFFGSVAVSAGTLQIGNGGAAGSVSGGITDNANLVFNRSDTVTFGGNISGNGSIQKAGAGTLILTGFSNTFAGTTTITAGTLQIGSGGAGPFLAGSFVNNSNLAFDVFGNTPITAVISGTGTVQQIGTGTTTFFAANTYGGGTVVSDGIFQLGAGGSLASTGPLTVNGGTFSLNGQNQVVGALSGSGGIIALTDATLTTNSAANTVLGSNFSHINNAGSLVKAGTGTLTLTGAFDGSLTIAGGTLQVGNGGTTGSLDSSNVTDNSVLSFDRTDSVAFGGVISGSGMVNKIGSGTLSLAGTNTYAGSTTVGAGTLNVTGSIANSAVNVTSGAKLTGTGRVGAVTVASGGTLSPGTGGAPGTLTVQGNLALASGANFVDAISPTVTGLANVSGTASVNGALIVNAASGDYVLGQRYTLLSANGGLSGSFSSINISGLSAYRTNIGYDASSVFVTLGSINALYPSLPTGLGANGVDAAKAIDAAIAGGATVNSGFNALFGLSGATLGSAVTQLSGETGADAAQGASQAFLPFVSTLMAEGISGSPTMTAANFAPGDVYGQGDAPKPAQLAAGSMRAWGTVYGRHTGIAADAAAGTQSLKAGDVGFAAGIEMQVNDDLRLGAAAGGGHGSFSAGNGGGGSDDAMLGVYGSLGVLDRGYVAGAFSYGWHDVDTLRLLTIFGTDLLGAKYTAHDVGVRMEGGWRVALDDEDGLVPYAAFVWDRFQAPAYGETAASGSANFALSYAAQDTNFGQSELGLKAGRNIAVGDGAMALEVSAAWAHQLYGAPFAVAAFQALPGSSFAVEGGRIATDTALLGAGIDWRESDALSVGARMDSQLGGGTTALAGTGTISLRW